MRVAPRVRHTHTHSLECFLVAKAGTNRKSFNLTARFIMLLEPRHLASIRSTFSKTKGVIPKYVIDLIFFLERTTTFLEQIFLRISHSQ